VSESCTQVYAFLLELLKMGQDPANGLAWLFETACAYDAACQIRQFILNRRNKSPEAESLAAWAEVVCV
jgi:hypothetical protein